MEPLFMISGDADGLRACELNSVIRLSTPTRIATFVACESICRAHKQEPVSVVNRYMAFSASDRR
ncbi:hypothetical protein WJ90_30170 [Burkholderia ubonensis]|nr:hypothetical protein WI86_30820 [Burkholderia ubonensis]KVP59834.1 hypothetical protein WJ90_30170 [Burkholderia ubonensis]KVR45491.1 hypothetical protein WK16_08755 [Burkholderia ubonensis]KVU23500.1 hypothetical protein WK64_28390 [Burkholderia ubonensis]KVW28564.1 hypothetical protein WK94_08405 [Burkholderia ubonensis]